MADSITLKIFRYDPSVDAEPHYETYDVPFMDDGETDFMSILQCLSIAYDSCGDFTYDCNCSAGWCGRCAMMVNGRPRLACWTKAQAGKTYTIEPLAGFPVIRDLIVDKSVTYEKYVNAVLEVQRAEPMQTLVNIDYDFFYNTLYKFNRCRECMMCYSVCPKVQNGLTDSFIGPGAMMQIAMRYNDPNDEADRVWQAAFSGVFECDKCGKCNDVCPATIDIVGQIAKLQAAGEARGLGNCGAYIPPSARAVAAAIADAKAAADAGESGDTAGLPVEQIVKASCDVDGCHSASKVLEYRVDAETARQKVETHVAPKVELTEEQKDAFIQYFTK